MDNLTFLTNEEIFDDDKKLDVIRIRGTKAAITDFSILLGGYTNDMYHLDGKDDLSSRTGWYWTKTDRSGDACAVYPNGDNTSGMVTLRGSGNRPALEFSSIDEILANRVSERASDGVLEINYGFYPQSAANKNLQNILEKEFKNKKLKKLDKKITTDSRKYNEFDKEFLAKEHEVYEYENKKYIRVIANSLFNGEQFSLSNGEMYKDGDAVWIEIEPIKAWVDEKSKKIIFEKILFAGVQFNKTRDYKIENFENTDIKQFMEQYFYPELLQFEEPLQIKKEVNENINKRTRLQSINPDTTDLSERRKMTDTEIIYNWIEAGHSVLLRGPSGIGKTERIKSLFPDLIYLKLTNNMFPEKVVGSVNLQTGQNIPPSYAKEALLQCANEEEKKLIEENIQNLYKLTDTIYERTLTSDKKVVILLDELLNVKPAIQSLVYTLVLNRLVETGKGLKLPANTVIVATGNQKKYSMVAEDLAEALEKRFDHILDMEPKVSEWLNEYAIPNKVHPSVIGYILSKYMAKGRSEKLEDIGYFYEEPEIGEKHLDKFGCRGRTNDPRGWVSISNTLYNFEEDLKNSKFIGKDVEHILRMAIGSKLREEWAIDFFNFYNIPTISVEEVVNESYTQADLPRDINERYSCVMSLLLANENEVGVCREFIRKYCDPEYLQVYDMCWVGNDLTRMEIINELQEMNAVKEVKSL